MADPTEHRLAIVLNGGISLAVWMGGVVHEIENLRRASNGIIRDDITGGLDEAAIAEQEILERWAAAAEARNERITVDVIGGTSAGGLNGVFHATAIARGASLAPLRRLWIEDGQLAADALLTPQRPRATSLLSGSYFLSSIEAALAAIVPGPGMQDDRRFVSLTTTASAYAGLPRALVDSGGAPFTQADHRRRYRFEETGQRIHYERDPSGSWGFTVLEDGHRDFDAEDAVAREALARAARATASIPGVFEPVEEAPALRAKRSWPVWPTTKPGDPPEWLLDGGLLDNSPFAPVLELVAKQSVGPTWRRTVCFVVPDGPDPDAGAPARPGASGPPPWDGAVGRLLSYPGEGNLRDDLDLVARLIRSGRTSDDLERFGGLVADPVAQVDGPDGLAPLAKGLLSLYAQSRASAALLDTVDAVDGGSASGRMDPTRRFDVHGVVADAHDWLPTGLPTVDADLDAPWQWGISAADRLARLMLQSLRTADVDDASRTALDDVVHRIAALRKAFDSRLAATSAVEWHADDAVAVAKALDAAYQDLDVAATLGGLVRDAARVFAPTTRATELQVVRAALCLEAIDGAPGLPAASEPSPVFDFARFGIEAVPHYLGHAPADVDPASILYGERLGRFAAFGRPEWREWDWLWGRIHGAIHLGALLRLHEEDVEAIVRLILTAEGTDVATVRRTAAALLSGETDLEILRVLAADGHLAEAARSLTSLLGDPAPTDPPLRSVVATAGSFVAAALGRGHRARQRHPIVRLLLWVPRIMVWRRLR